MMSQIEIAHLTYNFLKKTNMQSKFIKRLLNYKKQAKAATKTWGQILMKKKHQKKLKTAGHQQRSNQ